VNVSICIPTKSRPLQLNYFLQNNFSKDFEFVISVERNEMSLYDKIITEYPVNVIVLDNDKGIGHARSKLAEWSYNNCCEISLFFDDNVQIKIGNIRNMIEEFENNEVQYLSGCNYLNVSAQRLSSESFEKIFPVYRLMAQVFAFRTNIMDREINFDDKLYILEDADFILKILTTFYPKDVIFAHSKVHFIKSRWQQGGNRFHDDDNNLIFAVHRINNRFGFPVIRMTDNVEIRDKIRGDVKGYLDFLEMTKF